MNYLIPVEEVASDDLLDYKALRVQHVLERIESAGCNLNLLFLDACRSKPPPMSRGTRSLGRGLAKMEANTGSVIAFACAAGQTAADGTGRNGVFTANLLNHLGRPNVDVDFMLGDVAEAVEQATGGEQTPFRNHNLKGRRPCCLLTTADGATAAPSSGAPPNRVAAGTTIETELSAFLASCRLDANQQTDVAAALRGIGVTSASHLDLCDDDDLRLLTVPPVVLKLLRKALEARGGETKLKEQEAEALKRISAAVSAEDLAAIVAEMKAHAGNAAVLEQACQALQTLTEANKSPNRIKAGDAGAVEAVTAALKAFTDRPGLLTSACLVLLNLTYDLEANQERAVAARAIEVVMAAFNAPNPGNAVLVTSTVLRAVRQVRDDVDIAQYGGWVLQVLYLGGRHVDEADHVPPESIVETSHRIFNVIATAMKAIPNSVVCDAACSILNCLCGFAEELPDDAKRNWSNRIRVAGLVELLKQHMEWLQQRADAANHQEEVWSVEFTLKEIAALGLGTIDKPNDSEQLATSTTHS